MKLEDLIKRVDPAVEGIVETVRREWNDTFRKQIRSDSRLNLASGKSRESVPIRIAAGLPLSLMKLGSLEVDPLIEHFVQVRREMECARADLAKIYEVLKNLPGLDGKRRSHIADQKARIVGLRAFFADTLREVIAKSVVQYILEVNEDVLGIYRSGPYSEIVLFWAVIGFVARGLGTDPAGLAGVVLAHELAHAYTHLGVDADGNTWEHFSKSESELKEGLAQYYTDRIAKEQGSKFPGLLDAYRTLTPQQPPKYQRHLTWTDRWPLEVVRAAMLQARTQKAATIAQFELDLEEQKRRLLLG